MFKESSNLLPTISAKSVETLSLLRNLGQSPPRKSFPLTLSPPNNVVFFSPTLPLSVTNIEGGRWGRGGSMSGKCNVKAILPPRGGGGYSMYPWLGRCGAAPHTLTLFKTNIADFLTHFKTEFRFLIPCLRHLTQFKTKIDKSIP